MMSSGAIVASKALPNESFACLCVELELANGLEDFLGAFCAVLVGCAGDRGSPTDCGVCACVKPGADAAAFGVSEGACSACTEGCVTGRICAFR